MILSSITTRKGDTFHVCRASSEDVTSIVKLLRDDPIGAAREPDALKDDISAVQDAFHAIDKDPNQLLLVLRDASSSSTSLYSSPSPSPSPSSSPSSSSSPSQTNSNGDIVDVAGTLQLTFIPGLSRGGMLRAQIEAVRVRADERGTGLGSLFLQKALDECRKRGAGMAQLTTDKRREDAHRFYEKLGFVASHEGMKLPLL
eukprot:TRINITY_DN1008_c0_g1_i2.p1 TRINITY_DN1008_c0_g1~~TRINITY_DN1008_c0_g1_i2.p1  ORF type:complete len:201 (+),score=50.91 TRINITY_DN1008_c0_g1_i2:126-728(+)